MVSYDYILYIAQSRLEQRLSTTGPQQMYVGPRIFSTEGLSFLRTAVKYLFQEYKN
jgi:hypothetical protein